MTLLFVVPALAEVPLISVSPFVVASFEEEEDDEGRSWFRSKGPRGREERRLKEEDDCVGKSDSASSMVCGRGIFAVFLQSGFFLSGFYLYCLVRWRSL